MVGLAMEFAFGLERPVLFVDVPRKMNNLVVEIGIVPWRILPVGDWRGLDPERPGEAPDKIEALHESSGYAPCPSLRARYVFNPH